MAERALGPLDAVGAGVQDLEGPRVRRARGAAHLPQRQRRHLHGPGARPLLRRHCAQHRRRARGWPPAGWPPSSATPWKRRIRGEAFRAALGAARDRSAPTATGCCRSAATAAPTARRRARSGARRQAARHDLGRSSSTRSPSLSASGTRCAAAPGRASTSCGAAAAASTSSRRWRRRSARPSPYKDLAPKKEATSSRGRRGADAVRGRFEAKHGRRRRRGHCRAVRDT